MVVFWELLSFLFFECDIVFFSGFMEDPISDSDYYFKLEQL